LQKALFFSALPVPDLPQGGRLSQLLKLPEANDKK